MAWICAVHAVPAGISKNRISETMEIAPTTNGHRANCPAIDSDPPV